MEIEDNGKSFEANRVPVAKRHKRWGRLGIRERVDPVGDSVAVVSAPGQSNHQARPDSIPQQSLRKDLMNAQSIEKAATAIQRKERLSAHLARKLIMVMAGSSSRLGRTASHPIGAALCLALGYMVLCSAYIFFSGRIAAGAAWSID